MSSPLEDASSSLGKAQRAVAGGGLQCLRGNVEADLERFRDLVLQIQDARDSITDTDAALLAITSHSLHLAIIADKSSVMQALLHEQLHEASERAHTAVDAVAHEVKTLRIKPRETPLDPQRRAELVQQAANASHTEDLEVQAEALAFIACQETHTRLDPLTTSIKERLLAVASSEIIDKSRETPDWYITEQLLETKKRGDACLPDRGVEQIDREAWSVIQDVCHGNAILRPSMQIVMMSLRSLARSNAATAASTHASSYTAPVVNTAQGAVVHAGSVNNAATPASSYPTAYPTAYPTS